MKNFDDQFKSVFIDEDDTFNHSKALEEALNVAERRLVHRTIMPGKSFVSEAIEHAMKNKATHTGRSIDFVAIDEALAINEGDNLNELSERLPTYQMNIFKVPDEYDDFRNDMLRKLFNGKFLKPNGGNNGKQ